MVKVSWMAFYFEIEAHDEEEAERSVNGEMEG
jgi:hypothetical protein